ncbi:MAG: FHA domain-containing protein [Myxococcales bacterium]|nr:FHA domain-containing protein [Myxococcales bacterium]
MAFVLTIAEGKGRGQKFKFEIDNVTIGRGAENDVVLNDAGVSRMHARIERQGVAWMLLDNGSANGTELNGAVLQKPMSLRAGDRIGVGPVTFEFFSESDETRITSPAPKREVETRVSAMPAPPRAIEPKAGAVEQLPAWVKIAAAGGAALILVGVARTAVQSRAQRGLACPDTVAVDDDTASFTFGHLEADVDCGDKVVFGFNVPQQTRVLFHYQPMRISTPSELELRVNGKHLAWAPVVGARGEPQVVTIPQESLSADGRNFVTFSENQRDKDWAVAKVRVEMLAITPGDLLAARQAYDRGRRKLEEKRIAPRNLYDAWKAFADARRQMEGLPQKPALYAEVAQLIKDCERDLDRECGKLLFSAARFTRYGQDDKAQQTYREVLLHFPGEDPTGCRKKAQENIVSAQTAAASE